MGKKRSFARFLSPIFISIVFFPCLAFSSRVTLNSSKNCSIQTSSCGNLTIKSPFYLKGNPPNCGNKSFELKCEGNTDLYLTFESESYVVKEIFYEKQSLRLVDQQLAFADCPKSERRLDWEIITKNGFQRCSEENMWIIYSECSGEVDDPTYLEQTCSNDEILYFHVGPNSFDQTRPGCTVKALVPLVSRQSAERPKLGDVRQYLRMGFQICWAPRRSPSISPAPPNSNVSSHWSDHKFDLRDIIGYALFTRISLGILHLFAVIVYVLYQKCAKKKLGNTHEALGTCRYSYSDIKKMTNNLKEKLGEGGFGSVYKGRLHSGQLVAVKMLKKSKGNAEEFINEVTTIGGIHHVNVVRLVGFCSEGSRCALVYEFMPNGSLEKYIFSNVEMKHEITWEKLLEIALGIARGMEYLHRGCNLRILHFDIKPHNILLDDNFNPKISDFGLAKLSPADYSIVSMSTARGTPGYMAPELISKNFGGISYKSDVYSFGMLLLEIAGRRKNFSRYAEHSSQIYFPTWMYEKLALEWETGHENAAKIEGEISKKLAVVGLWCIQMSPEKRPSMSRVVEMLEESNGVLEMPPKPFLASPERPDLEDISLSDKDSISLLQSL